MPSYLPMFAIATIDIKSIFDRFNIKYKIQQSEQNLFDAIAELNKSKFTHAINFLDQNNINILDIKDQNANNPLTVLVQKCKQEIQAKENQEADCKNKSEQILKIYPAKINKEQIKLKKLCVSDPEFKQRCITCDEMLQLLLTRKYIDLGDYSINAMHGFKMAQYTTLQQSGFNFYNYKKILDLLVLGNDALLANVLMQDILRSKSTKRPSNVS